MKRLLFGVAIWLSYFVCSPLVASSQDAAAIQQRVAKIEGFLEYLESDNSLIRQAAIEEGVKSEDPLMQKAAIKAGFASSDIDVRKMALLGVLKDKPQFFVEIAESAIKNQQQEQLANSWRSVVIKTPTDFLDPDGFTLIVASFYYNCILRGDEISCRYGNRQLSFFPGANGTLTGTITDNGVSVPLLIRNY